MLAAALKTGPKPAALLLNPVGGSSKSVVRMVEGDCSSVGSLSEEDLFEVADTAGVKSAPLATENTPDCNYDTDSQDSSPFFGEPEVDDDDIVQSSMAESYANACEGVHSCPRGHLAASVPEDIPNVMVRALSSEAFSSYTYDPRRVASSLCASKPLSIRRPASHSRLTSLEYNDDGNFRPPHEIVASTYVEGSKSLATRGSAALRVRNSVLNQTGYLRGNI